ncbi:MAG: OsmC family peroxiredoxin [Chitinophagaceae bacterium]|nr:MAG: OsmC family peroxiredoxin [Chitinophagaceae bacterium]
MKGEHKYSLQLTWTGNRGSGTSGYRDYDRAHSIIINGKPQLEGSSDPSFRGDATKYNPEELLVASVSSCHMLWYLHLCAEAGVVVTDYRDNASGTMQETADGGGKFTGITLFPEVTIKDAQQQELANELHHRANKLCFIANSVNFPVMHQPSVLLAQ